MLFKGGKLDGKFNGGKLRFGKFKPAKLLGKPAFIVVGVLVESPEAPVVTVGLEATVVFAILSKLGKFNGGNPGICGKFKFNSGKLS